jgi:hypothetical protein
MNYSVNEWIRAKQICYPFAFILKWETIKNDLYHYEVMEASSCWIMSNRDYELGDPIFTEETTHWFMYKKHGVIKYIIQDDQNRYCQFFFTIQNQTFHTSAPHIINNFPYETIRTWYNKCVDHLTSLPEYRLQIVLGSLNFKSWY